MYGLLESLEPLWLLQGTLESVQIYLSNTLGQFTNTHPSSWTTFPLHPLPLYRANLSKSRLETFLTRQFIKTVGFVFLLRP
jgi:hypothetical protein